jgi:hypothetical protein
LIEFLTEMLGVKPAAPGFAEITVAPQPCGLTWASGSVPTPRGPVTVHWEDGSEGFRIKVQSPPGVTVHVVSPDGECDSFAGGNYESVFPCSPEAAGMTV